MRRKRIFIERVEQKYHVEVEEKLLEDNRNDVVGQIITFLNQSHSHILLSKMGQIKITPLSGSFRKVKMIKRRRR